MEQTVKKSKGKRTAKIILIILLSLIIVFYIVSFFIVQSVFNDMFGRAEIPENSVFYRYEDMKDKYPREEVTFKSGKNTLTGFIYGNENTKGLVVISHGHGGYSESYFSETRWFVDNGYKVFAFDNTGSGHSEGDGTTGMAQSVIDLDAALTFAESDERLSSLPVFLYGHSWGGYAVTAVLSKGHDIAASVSIAGYDTPMGIVCEFAEEMITGPLTIIEYPVLWVSNKIRFGSEANISAVDSINSTDTPVLIVHGRNDETVEIDGAAIINQKDKITNPNVQYYVNDGDHLTVFMSEEAGKYFVETEKRGNEIIEKYGDEIPEDIEKEYFESVDKDKISELLPELMDKINDFYMNSLK